MSAGMDASVAPAFCHPAFPAGLLRRRQHGLLACCLRSLYLLLCLLVFCPAEAGAEGDLPPAPPAPSLSLELEQLDLSGLPGLPPLPAEDEVLPAAATQALPLPDEAPAADAGAEADAALPEAPRWNALEEGLEYAEFSLQSEAGQQASLTVLRIDPELFDFRLYASAAHKHPARTLGQWADSHDLVAAINASMYLPDGVTSTGYMRQDDYINNKRLVRRFGAFFVAGPRQEGLPRADILTREDPQWQELLEQYRLVIQNYRMINDERRILWSPGGPLYAISAVAEDGAGKILFLQNYDMELARRMVQGVDVWLNTPTRPLEASGTSGEKCVMNGVLQFSVLDGWWVEGYKEGAGWMLPMERTFADQHYQDELDAEMIYNTIEEQIAPKYYARDTDGIPHEWVSSVKRCVADIASNFTTNRMLTDYENRFYDKLAARKREMSAEAYRMAREIAAWKRKVSTAWDQVRIVDVQRVKIDKEAVCVGEKYQFAVTLDIANLRPEDIGVEMVVARQIVGGQSVNVTRTIQLERTKANGSRVTYSLDYTPDEAGTFDVALRIYPSNPLLPHRMDFALVKWA